MTTPSARSNGLRLAAAALLAAALPAQTPWCTALNESAPATGTFDVPYYGRLTVRFSPASTITSNLIEVLGGTTLGHGLTVEARWVDPQTGLAQPTPAATAELGGFFGPPSGWQSAAWSAVLPLNPSETYQLDFVASPNLFTFPASYPLVSFPLLVADAATAPDALAYDFACFTTFCAGVPVTGTIAPKIRLYGGSCGLPGLATSHVLGEACQASGPAATLACFPPPIPGLNSTVLIGATGAAGTPVFLFWSVGVDSLGGATTGAGGCPIYLDLATLAILNAVGLEPLAAVPATGFSMTGVGIDWPNEPSFVGLVLGMQAVIADAAGLPSPVPGLLLRTTPGLRLVVGY